MVKKYMKESNRKMSRRNIKESLQGGLRILAGKGWVTMHEDHYDVGQGKFFNEWDIDVRGTYSSMEDFIKAVQMQIDVPSDPKDWGIIDNRLVTNFLGDEDALEADSSEIKAWESGDLQLYIVDVDIPIKLVTERDITEDDADLLGVSVW